VPEMAESISEGTLKQFSKQVGDYVELDEEIATIETDKIDVAVNAPAAGTIKELLANEEDTVTVGQDLVRLETGGPAPEGGAQKAKDEPKSPASDAQETSSQPEGQKEEAKSAPSPPKEESKPEPPKQESKPASQPPKQPEKKEPKKDDKAEQSKPAAPGAREERRVKMNRMRLRIAERLKQSQNTAASLTTFNEVDMSGLMEMRKLYKDEILKKTGIKLGFMSAFSKAAILAMKEIPAVNASIEGAGSGDTIVYRDYVDISIAVATEKGLVTPVVRNAESLDMIGIEQEIANLGKKVYTHALSAHAPADLSTNIHPPRPATIN
jgi:2-oxoglutarate dehydrogenase E2 component (dihydrolipoamide succinyltransferase)